MNKLILLSLFAIFLSGCSGSSYNKNQEPSMLVKVNHTAGTNLINIAKGQLSKDKPLIIASFVNIDDLSRSSSFGRIASHQVATEFTKSGYKIVEMLLSRDIYVRERQGEFLLSRKLQKIGTDYDAQAVIVGTYAVGKDYVYVTTKVINSLNNNTISSFDYKVPKDDDMNQLLKN